MLPAQNLRLLSYGLKQEWYTYCMHNNVYAHTHANTHNRKSVNEWEGAGRLAGAVLVEDMASVHLSISKHSQLSSLSTGGEVSPFFSFLACITVLLSSPHFCSSLFLPSHLSTTPPLPFIHSSPLGFHLSAFFFSAPAFSRFFLFPLHPSPHHPFLPRLLLAVSCALSGTAHSATKQSCLQHHTLANQARPEFSSPSDPLNGTMIPAPHWRGEVSHTRRRRKRRIRSG